MPWVIGLTISALVGLIVLQAFLLNSSYELKEQAFAQNVWSALLSASFRMQAGETLTGIQSWRHAEPVGQSCDSRRNRLRQQRHSSLA